MDKFKFYKSDFRLLVTIDTKYKGPDDSIVPLTSADQFIFKFWTTDRDHPYICSSTGGANPELTNCRILAEDKVMCNFDRTLLELNPGRLMLEAEFIVNDADFKGDNKNNVKRYYTTSLILTEKPDLDSEGDHTEAAILIDCLRADVTTERGRAMAAEQQLANVIAAENTRALNAEEAIRDNVQELVRTERQRAQDAEDGLSSDIDAETQRARTSEQAISGNVAEMMGKIPSQASSSNQLADKDFVNSSIETATADFKGTYNSLAELQQVTGNKNDYGYVITADAQGNTAYNRYKWVVGTGWVFEYQLNNSSFTAAEWAAIQSGITQALVTKLAAMPDGVTVVDGAVCVTVDA